MFQRLVLLKLLSKKIHREGNRLLSERLTEVFRVVLLEAAGPQITTEQGAEPGREGFTEAVGDLHGFLFFQALFRSIDADEHQRSFHKAALGTKTSAAVHADGRGQNLWADFHTKFLPQAEKSGNGAVIIFVVIELAYELVMVCHGRSHSLKITGGGRPAPRCR